MADCIVSQSEAKRAMMNLARLQCDEDETKRKRSKANSSASSEFGSEKDERVLSAIRKRVRILEQQTKPQVEAGNVTNSRISNGKDAEISSTGASVGFSAFDQAKELQQTSSQRVPSFDKLLHISDLSAGKYMDLPKDFCDKHFPRPEGSLLVVDILLVGEDNLEYSMSYSFQTQRFLGQWRDFYLKHKLALGDAIKFCQIGNNKFKVEIVKASTLTGNGGADKSSSSNLSNHHDREDVLNLANEIAETPKTVKEEDMDLFTVDAQEEKISERSSTSSIPLADERDHCGSITGSGVDVHHSIPESAVNFLKIKHYDDFKIHMNMQIPYFKIATSLQLRYYELCCHRKKFLHEPVTGLSGKEVATVIEETTRIAMGIKTSSVFTSFGLEIMEKQLKSFEECGMDVGFLRESIRKLVKLCGHYQTLDESRIEKLAQIESKRCVLQKESLKLEELIKSITADRSVIDCLEVEVDSLEKESKELDFEFKEVTDSLW